MPEPFLLSRLLLRFDNQSSKLLQNISAVTTTPDGSLWVGSDELATIERLSPLEPHIFGNHKSFEIADFLDLSDPEGEVDIEGFAYANQYLWFTGSHSTKRSKPKGKKTKKDIQKLTEVETQPNRYLLGRIPVSNGELFKSCSQGDTSGQEQVAASLEKTQNSNLLMEVLREDLHLGTYVSSILPGKENGFDIEGMAVYENRVFLGLRGPVLRGWAIILEIEVAEPEPGRLTLKEIGKAGQPYKKHFVDLNGLGVRELCLCGEDLIILAGPTMDLEGAMQIFQLKHVLDSPKDTLHEQDAITLEVLFELPFINGSDHAEGLALFSCLGQSDALVVVYDSPNQNRKIEPNALFVDVFKLR